MRVRFQADADLNLAILFGLQRREPSIDFHTAAVADLANRHDLEVLEIAAAEDGVVGEVDLSDLVGRGVFSRLNEPGEFQKVAIAPSGDIQRKQADFMLCRGLNQSKGQRWFFAGADGPRGFAASTMVDAAFVAVLRWRWFGSTSSTIL